MESELKRKRPHYQDSGLEKGRLRPCWSCLSDDHPCCDHCDGESFYPGRYCGAIVCALAWMGNRVLLNLLPLDDAFLWCIRTHFPEQHDPDFDVDVIEGTVPVDKEIDP